MTFAPARLLALSALVLIGLVLGLACSREEPEEELDPYALAASPTPNLDVHIIMTMEIAFATRVAGRELTPRPAASGRFQPPCTGSLAQNCRIPDPEVVRMYSDKTVCDAPGRKVCLVPLGAVSLQLIQHLVSYYRDTYGLTLHVLPPLLIRPLAEARGDQTAVSMLRGNMAARYKLPRDEDLETILIGLTPIDLYQSERPSLLYVFGQRYGFDVNGEMRTLQAIVSTFRMEEAAYSRPGDRDLTYSRVRKMINKYIAIAYYDIPLSRDPFSATYDGIGGLEDLDHMPDTIPGVR